MFVGMFTLVFLPMRLFLSARDGRELALENLALRQQLAVMKRLCPRPRLPKTHRLFCFWRSRVVVKTCSIEPESLSENGLVESFNGKFRDECLNREISDALALPIVLIEQGRQEYNHVRPHRALG
jgi:hypothetical protein